MRKYARDRRIPVFEFHVSEPSDLKALRDSNPLVAECREYCLKPKCPNCSEPMFEKILEIVDAKCWKCKAKMKVARIQIGALNISPEEFSVAEKAMARECGVLLKAQYSRTTRTHYVANTCPSCSSFIGEYHLFEDYGFEAASAYRHLGFGCQNC